MKILLTSVACATAAIMMTGCAGVRRTAPVAPAHINVNMDRNDYEVIGNTEGKSSVTSILGVIKIIDGEKLSIAGIKFFEDQYAFQDTAPKDLFGFIIPPMATVEDRAYYQALAAVPDADAVVQKSCIKTSTGFPGFMGTDEVTYYGKALKYKVHH